MRVRVRVGFAPPPVIDVCGTRRVDAGNDNSTVASHAAGLSLVVCAEDAVHKRPATRLHGETKCIHRGHLDGNATLKETATGGVRSPRK